ncbi:MAG: hypothetical protein NZM04_00850 [Methylacidiphilales bacterium]|nr:hypothetical protein [Candidatus Methylacidiphilales bacterium]
MEAQTDILKNAHNLAVKILKRELDNDNSEKDDISICLERICLDLIDDDELCEKYHKGQLNHGSEEYIASAYLGR